ncbi:MAG: response regulator [Caldilineaceae bacterium]
MDKLRPDVILLDLMMPGMNGFDVCSHIKHSQEFRHVPVIMVTALDDIDYLVTGLDTGADEFISKPMNGAELRARVRSMLRIKHQYDELDQALHLRELISRMIVHDMRNPLSSILLYSQVIQRKQQFPPEQLTQVVQIQNEALRLGKLFDDMLVLSRMQRGQIVLQEQMTDLATIVTEQHDKYQPIAAANEVKLRLQLDEDLAPALLDTPLIERMVETLLANAIKFAPAQSSIQILLAQMPAAVHIQSSAEQQSIIRLQMIDQGPQMPATIFDTIFQQLESGSGKSSARPATELGLAFCKMVVDAHGGTISVTENQPQGVMWTIDLPYEI